MFGASQTVSIRLKDWGNVEADIGPLFGSITLNIAALSEQYANYKVLKA